MLCSRLSGKQSSASAVPWRNSMKTQLRRRQSFSGLQEYKTRRHPAAEQQKRAYPQLHTLHAQMHAYVLFSLVGLAVQSLKVIAHGVRWKINTTSRCVDHVYTLSPKLSSVKKKNWNQVRFSCVFASVASILIGSDDEYKNMENAYKNFGLSVQGP